MGIRLAKPSQIGRELVSIGTDHFSPTVAFISIETVIVVNKTEFPVRIGPKLRRRMFSAIGSLIVEIGLSKFRLYI